MKFVTLMNLVLGSTLTITAVGCKTHVATPRVIPPNRGVPTDTNIDPGNKFGGNSNPFGESANSHMGDQGIKAADQGQFSNYIEDRTALKAQTAYFDFDKSTIKASEQSKLDEVASYLKQNSAAALRIEGNCDERGTEEYNRGLGDRRAQSAREYLAHAGIDPQKILTLSNGQDHPAESGHSAAAWAKNRRDEFVVLNPPGNIR